MKRNGFAPIIIVIIIALTGLIAGGYFIYKNYLPENLGSGLPKKSSPTPLASEVPKKEEDPTANWKTYSSSTFSVKYPQDATFHDEEPGVIAFSKWGPTQKPETEAYDGYSVSFQPKEIGNATLEAFVKAKIDEINKAEITKVISGPTPITINNYSGLSYVEEGQGKFTNIVLQSKNKSMFMLITYYAADPGKLGFQKIVDQILSTFKFIE